MDDGRHLTDKEYLYRLVKEEKKLMWDVIKGVPFSEMNKRVNQKVRPSTKMFNDPEEDPYTPYREIRAHTVIERGIRVRPINRTGELMASSTKQDMANFSANDRILYKMVVLQMVENLNYISAKYAHKRINCKNPTKEIKEKILNYYH